MGAVALLALLLLPALLLPALLALPRAAAAAATALDRSTAHDDSPLWRRDEERIAASICIPGP